MDNRGLVYDHGIFEGTACDQKDTHVPGCPCRAGGDPEYNHDHEWEHGTHMAEAFGIDGRRAACAICGIYRHDWIDPNDLPGPAARIEPSPLPSPLPPMQLPLSRGVVALVDAEDFELVNRHHWWATQGTRPGASMYVARRVRNQFIYLHRWLFGLFWNASAQRWFASIKVNKQVRYLGGFDNPAHAALAYDAAAREAFGEYARPNFDLATPLSLLRCSECGDLLDDGICENHGRLDDGREGDPAWNGVFDKW